MRSQRSMGQMWWFCALILAAGLAGAQDFPAKPIRLITSAPGGSSDFTARLVAQGLSSSLGQQVIVDNRGNFGGDFLVKAAPDGYTMLLEGFSLWLGTVLNPKAYTYDPLTFTSITTAVKAPNVIVVNSTVPVKSIKELIAIAKEKPGYLNYGSAGAGGSTHLSVELLKAMANINIVNVNYAGSGPALNALLGGEVHLMAANATISTPHIKSGKLRPLGVTSATPSPIFPDIPTVASAGLPGYEALSILLITTPAKTPTALVNRLNQEIVRVLTRPDTKDRLFAIGVEPVASPPQDAAATIKSEMSKWGKLIKDLGITNN